MRHDKLHCCKYFARYWVKIRCGQFEIFVMVHRISQYGIVLEVVFHYQNHGSLKHIVNIIITIFQICDLHFARAPGFQTLLHIGT